MSAKLSSTQQVHCPGMDIDKPIIYTFNISEHLDAPELKMLEILKSNLVPVLGEVCLEISSTFEHTSTAKLILPCDCPWQAVLFTHAPNYMTHDFVDPRAMTFLNLNHWGITLSVEAGLFMAMPASWPYSIVLSPVVDCCRGSVFSVKFLFAKL